MCAQDHPQDVVANGMYIRSGMCRKPVLSMFVLLAFTCVPGCRKHETAPGDGGTALPGHIAFAVDSACLTVPNVITPNADGVNDVFFFTARNIDPVTIEVRDAGGVLVFQSQEPGEFWWAPDTVGIFQVHVQALTTSGVSFQGEGRLDLLDHDDDEFCITYSGTPVCADQLDPGTCGITGPTNDIFCP